MKKIFILILMIFPIIDIIAQSPTKADLRRLFKNSLEQNSRKLISTYSNPWYVDNGNDSYYKSDTITLINSINWNDLKICQTVNWTFYKKEKFILTKAQHCNEPPTIEVNKEDNWFNIEIRQTDSGLFLELYSKNELKEEFKVLDIIKEPDRTKIVLIRKSPASTFLTWDMDAVRNPFQALLRAVMGKPKISWHIEFDL